MADDKTNTTGQPKPGKPPHLKGGAGSGVGRLQKSNAMKKAGK